MLKNAGLVAGALAELEAHGALAGPRLFRTGGRCTHLIHSQPPPSVPGAFLAASTCPLATLTEAEEVIVPRG